MTNKKPNVVIITADELRADYVSCIQKNLPTDRASMGAAGLVETPNIDSIAKHGALFTQAFVQHGKCTPSRCSIFTGMYPSSGGHRTLHLKLHTGERHLAETLRKNGYTTVLIGRNHIVEDNYLTDSFDLWFNKTVDKPTDYPETIGDPMTGAFYRGRVLSDLSETSDGLNAKFTLDWLDNAQEPFFLWYNLFNPHPPYQAPDPFFSNVDRDQVNLYPICNYKDKPDAMQLIHKNYGLEKLSGSEWREIIAVYGGMVSAVDFMVGQLIEHLRSNNLLENTILVFFSDHGDFAGQYQLVEKWDCLFQDCLLHTPLIITIPWLEIRGKNFDTLVEMVDLAPTLYELCEVKPPPGLAGKSLLPLIKDHSEIQRKSVYAEGGRENELLEMENPYLFSKGRPIAYAAKYKVFFDNPQTLARSAMVRTQNFKLVQRLYGMGELYDLDKDPGELDNVYNNQDYRDVRDEMTRLLVERILEAQPKIPPATRPGV
jgi:choline-sulfatase